MRLARRSLLAALLTVGAMALCAAPSFATQKIVISQFQTGGPSGVNDEFVVLVNTGDEATDIGHATILRTPGEGQPGGCTALYVSPTVFVVQPGQHVLAAGTNYSGSVTKDLSIGGSGAGAPCGAANDNFPAAKALLSFTGGNNDALGYGGTAADFPTWGTFPPPASGGSARRKNNGSLDTDAASDWELLAASQPHNTTFVDANFDGDNDSSDNCPGVSNPDQVNTDGDAQGDACDPDDDNDGVADASDNCPLAANADQADNDADGLGNACDPTPGGGPGGGNTLTVKLTRAKSRLNGTVLLVLNVPAAGKAKATDIPLSAVGAARQRLFKTASATATAAGKLRLVLRPTRAGKKRLAKKGRFRAGARVTFAATNGGKATPLTKRLLFKKRRR